MLSKLTKQQEALIPEYIEKYIRLASQPIDRSKLPRLVEEIFGKDKIFIVGESMQNTIDLIKLCLSITNKKIGQQSIQLYNQLDSQLSNQLDSQLNNQLYNQLYNQLDNQLDNQLYSQLNNQLDNQLYNQLRSQLYSQLYSQLNNQLSNQLYNQLDNQLYNQLDNQLYSQLDNQLYSQLYSQLDNQLYSQLSNQLKNTNWSYYIGIWWNVWLGWYMYGKEIGVKFDEERLQLYKDIIENLSNIIIFVGDIIFICEKPLVRWENKIIHSDQKMAIEWKDGTGFYYLDDTNFDKELWEKVLSKKMTFSEIMKIEVSDQRTIALKHNPEAIIKEHAKLIHKDDRNNELYCIENQQINKDLDFPKIWFLKMLCPTGRTFIEGVDPNFAEKHPDATECQAEACNLSLLEYKSLRLES